MRKMSRMTLAAVLAASSFVTIGAQATDNPCDDDTVIFSRARVQPVSGGPAANVPSVNANALTCLADDLSGGDVETGDNRRLAPGANQVTVRYVQDLGPETLVAVLNGLGFSNTEVALVYTPVNPDTGLGGTSDSAYINIPDGTASGVLSADVYQIGSGGVGDTRTLLDSVHFRTADQL
ncbi:MAG TPA: hypothetical protein VNA87_02835 [Actinomycetota bacterium]|nr:hypothetical protein [Actinomycetota bacterium]